MPSRDLMKIKIDHSSSSIWLILEGIAVGFIVFGIIYGFGPLNVTNDKWIMSGYDELDINQHYAGWVAFRNSAWHFPIGLADGMGGGTYISFTDSIPWFAIFFKLILQIVSYNGTFQYFGLYGLLCYILQAVAAGLLIRRKTSNHFIICACMVLLCFSPILMERSLRHTALGSQWLILFAMYAYLKFLDHKCKGFPAAFSVLSLLAVGIHPYFLPLVLVFSFLAMLSSLYRRTNIPGNFWGFVWSIVLPVAGGRVLGALGGGVSATRGGYGFYSMNINAVLNPTSCGGYEWSTVFKVHPQILGNYDGFNYLGLGYLFLIFLALLTIVVVPPKWNKYKALDAAAYVVTAVGMTAFAISNVVTFNDKTLANINLPEAILNLCGIFRASSRIFYFTYYSLVIFSLYRILDTLSISLMSAAGTDENMAGRIRYRTLPVCFVVCAVGLLQLFDLSQVIMQKHTAMTEKLKFVSIIDDINLAEAVKGKHYLISETVDRNLAVFAGKNHLATSYSVANSGDYSAEWSRGMRMRDDFVMGVHKNDIVVAYSDIGLAKEVFKNREVNSTSKYFESSGFAFIIADKNTEHSRNPNNFIALAFTDQTWTKGIKNVGNTILFGYSDDLLNVVNSSRYVSVEGSKAAITHIDVIGTSWIWVTIDKDAHGYAFPNIIHFSK